MNFIACRSKFDVEMRYSRPLINLNYIMKLISFMQYYLFYYLIAIDLRIIATKSSDPYKSNVIGVERRCEI